MKKINFIFDFDGTLADTLSAIKSIACKLYAECGYGVIKDEDIEEMRGMSARQVIKKMGIPWWKIPFIVKRGREELSANIENLLPAAGIESALNKLREKGHKLYIVSSNSRENIEKFLAKNGLAGIFSDIYPVSSLWGKSRVLKKMMAGENLRADNVAYVGDEIRDIEAARKAGVRIVAVAWGFNTGAALRNHNPDYFAEKPEDFLEIAENI